MLHGIYDKSVDLIEEGFSLSSTWFNQYVLKTQTGSQIIPRGCAAILWEMKMRETNTQQTRKPVVIKRDPFLGQHILN